MERKQFEYKSVSGNLKTNLNKYGLDGWELCGVVQVTIGEIVYYFKREKDVNMTRKFQIITELDKFMTTTGEVKIQMKVLWFWITIWCHEFIGEDDKEYVQRCAVKVKEKLEEGV